MMPWWLTWPALGVVLALAATGVSLAGHLLSPHNPPRAYRGIRLAGLVLMAAGEAVLIEQVVCLLTGYFSDVIDFLIGRVFGLICPLFLVHNCAHFYHSYAEIFGSAAQTQTTTGTENSALTSCTQKPVSTEDTEDFAHTAQDSESRRQSIYRKTGLKGCKILHEPQESDSPSHTKNSHTVQECEVESKLLDASFPRVLFDETTTERTAIPCKSQKHELQSSRCCLFSPSCVSFLCAYLWAIAIVVSLSTAFMALGTVPCQQEIDGVLFTEISTRSESDLETRAFEAQKLSNVLLNEHNDLLENRGSLHYISGKDDKLLFPNITPNKDYVLIFETMFHDGKYVEGNKDPDTVKSRLKYENPQTENTDTKTWTENTGRETRNKNSKIKTASSANPLIFSRTMPSARMSGEHDGVKWVEHPMKLRVDGVLTSACLESPVTEVLLYFLYFIPLALYWAALTFSSSSKSQKSVSVDTRVNGTSSGQRQSLDRRYRSYDQRLAMFNQRRISKGMVAPRHLQPKPSGYCKLQPCPCHTVLTVTTDAEQGHGATKCSLARQAHEMVDCSSVIHSAAEDLKIHGQPALRVTDPKAEGCSTKNFRCTMEENRRVIHMEQDSGPLSIEPQVYSRSVSLHQDAVAVRTESDVEKDKNLTTHRQANSTDSEFDLDPFSLPKPSTELSGGRETPSTQFSGGFCGSRDCAETKTEENDLRHSHTEHSLAEENENQCQICQQLILYLAPAAFVMLFQALVCWPLWGAVTWIKGGQLRMMPSEVTILPSFCAICFVFRSIVSRLQADE